jgi:iron complex outermembrane receptor protein
MTIGANGVKSFINIPYAIVAGVEASGFFKPLPSVDFVSTIRYTSATDNNNNPLPNIAPLKNISSVRYQPNKCSIQLEVESATSQHQISQLFGEDATDAYVLLHARFGYNFAISKTNIELQAGIENVFDKNYHEHLDWGNIARAGRNIYVVLKLPF